jgi:hypothetical protein
MTTSVQRLCLTYRQTRANAGIIVTPIGGSEAPEAEREGGKDDGRDDRKSVALGVSVSND